VIVTFERRRIDSNRLYGAIVSESESLILIQYEYDFEFDGYVVIRRRDVTKSTTSDSNRYCERLMRKEGLWKLPPKAVRAIPVENWTVLLSTLVGQVVIIENERKGDFWIGPVIECGPRFALIHHFDGCGCWKGIERIGLASITLVRFGDRYSTIHSRHLPPQPERASSVTRNTPKH